MALRRVWVIPLCTFMFSIAAFVVSYGVAVAQERVSAFIPYISDTGSFPPESCIFGQLLNLAALFLAITVYLRHRQIVEFYWHHHKKTGKWRLASFLLLWLGYSSAFGVSMVGNFQEMNILYVHYAGALMAFGCGLIYAWGQTIFSYKMNPKLTQPTVSHCRMLLCVSCTVFFFTMIIFGPILGRQPRNWHKKNEFYKWTPESPRFVEHMIGTGSEWLLAICFEIYILSFAIELRQTSCHAPKLCLRPNVCCSDQGSKIFGKNNNEDQDDDGVDKLYGCGKPRSLPACKAFQLAIHIDEFCCKTDQVAPAALRF